ncbi:MAG: extracellular solute-binding protein [Bacteroidetes bacterium]|nr:extracellular solute-binding protein [Bacteroidota bacterium]
MKGFQIGILIFFGAFLFLGVMVFSGAIKIPQKNSTPVQTLGGAVNIWGTIPKKNLNTAITFLNNQPGNIKINYTEKDPRTYEADLLNAFAFGGVPDVVILSQDLIARYEDKLITIPYTSFSERTFVDTYIRAADVFKVPTGFLGFPIFSDPLVMYYNRDLLEAGGFANPPKYWKDLAVYVPKLTKKNEALQISTAGIALGEFSNIKNAKEIFLAMNLQLNNPVVVKDVGGRYNTVLAEQSDVSSQPAIQSVNYFNEFSNPLKNIYSWNKSKQNSENEFISGDLAIYFGLASELQTLRNKNPNLNFDIAMIPQVEELNSRITYSDAYALAIPIAAPNAQAALTVAGNLANGSNTASFVGPSGFIPMRRDLIASGISATKYNSVLYDAALNSRSWFDVNDENTTNIFAKMMEDVTSGLSTANESVKTADTSLKQLLIKFK